MDQRLSFVTLAVDDVGATRAFYAEGLGWRPLFDDGDVLMIKVGPALVLSLWARASFEAEVGEAGGVDGTGRGAAPLTLAHNVATREEVDTVMAELVAAGGVLHRPAQERAWGGYTGYVADPDGYRWEVAWNPGPLGAEVLP